jgi:hypothetical protein
MLSPRCEGNRREWCRVDWLRRIQIRRVRFVSSRLQYCKTLTTTLYSIIVTVIASFLNWGKIFSFSIFFYTFCANAFFLVSPIISPPYFSNLTVHPQSQLRSLKYVLLPDSSNSSSVATISHSSRSKRIQFLFVIAMAQFLFMGLLARV